MNSARYQDARSIYRNCCLLTCIPNGYCLHPRYKGFQSRYKRVFNENNPTATTFSSHQACSGGGEHSHHSLPRGSLQRESPHMKTSSAHRVRPAHFMFILPSASHLTPGAPACAETDISAIVSISFFAFEHKSSSWDPD